MNLPVPSLLGTSLRTEPDIWFRRDRDGPGHVPETPKRPGVPDQSKLPACFGWEDGRNKGEFNSLEADWPNHTALLTAARGFKVAARDFSQLRPAFSGVPKAQSEVRLEVQRQARSKVRSRC